MNRSGSRLCRCSWRGRDMWRATAAALGRRARCWCQRLSLVTANRCLRSCGRRGLPSSRPACLRTFAKLHCRPAAERRQPRELRKKACVLGRGKRRVAFAGVSAKGGSVSLA